ncbi:SAV_6107 family HEPN domain-containing protein [Streptomyces avicenniae]|uniref:SAV_6107 family HEPN domain-containing protein n=1 Tax=Streptomyces avicenniae TaxID=500153 RepID=UPI00069C5A83|nr:SAV_6107 family HEPN domain-containing protein [Streptomyces avicenniae]
MTGLPIDVHALPRKAPVPAAAHDLLTQAERRLDEAAVLTDPGEAYVAAHLAALRAAAALIAVRGRPGSTERARRRIRSVWEVLPEIAPELAEWSVLFAGSADRRARIDAGVRGVAGRQDADELRRAAGFFVRLVDEALFPGARARTVRLPLAREAGDGGDREARGGGEGDGGARPGAQ